MLAQALCDSLGNPLIGDHSNFNGVRKDVAKNRIELCLYKIWRNVQHAEYAARILRRKRRNSARSKHFVRADRLDIGLNARAAAAVRTRDSKNFSHKKPLKF